MSNSEITLTSDSVVTLEDFMGGDDRTCLSAWVSFGTDDKERLEERGRVSGLINFLYREGHMTPFESTSFTFAIKTPIFVAREFFRHRTGKYNEWSGRYSEMVSDFYFPTEERPLIQKGKPGDYYFVPGTEEQFALVLKSFERAYSVCWEEYQTMLEAGIAKEVARDVLNLGMYTKFYVTFDARNLMHFLSLRNESHALFEIRAVAEQMEAIFAEKMPLTYAAYKAYNWNDQKEELKALRAEVEELRWMREGLEK